MKKKLKQLIFSNTKGFALAYVLMLTVTVIAIGGAYLFGSLAETKQANLHSGNINSFYLAQSGADILHLAFKRYIEETNNKTVEKYVWNDLQSINNYLDFLEYSPLGQPPSSSNLVIHLNLATNNNYFLAYASQPITNNLGNNYSLQASVALSSMGAPALVNYEDGEYYVYSFKYKITSKGEYKGALANNSTVVGEGIATIRFSSGTFAKYAEFIDINKAPEGYLGWVNSFQTYDGPVHYNDIIGFAGDPVFKDLVTSVHRYANFFSY